MKFEDVRPGMAVFPNENDEEAIAFIVNKAPKFIDTLVYIRPDREFREENKMGKKEFEFYFKKWRPIYTKPKVLREAIKELFEDEV